MNRKWIHFIGIALVCLLAGCGKSVEEQISEGVASAETIFEQKTVAKATAKIGKIQVYVPEEYVIAQGETEMNYIISKGNETSILFVNTIEAEDSRLHYNNLVNDSNLNIVKEETFEFEGIFGFTAVIQHSEKQFELVVSSGGTKMTTLTENKKMDEKLAEMTEIVRSVKVLNGTK